MNFSKQIKIQLLDYSKKYKQSFSRLKAYEKDEVVTAEDQLLVDPHVPWLGLHELHGFPGIYAVWADNNLRIVFELRGQIAALKNVGRHWVYEDYPRPS